MSLNKSIKHYAKFNPTLLSLPQLARFGMKPSLPQLYRSSLFLTEELPVRISHRINDLRRLPEDVGKQPSIVKVEKWYEESFNELLEFKSMTHDKYITPDLKKQLLKASFQFGILKKTKPDLDDYKLHLQDINKRDDIDRNLMIIEKSWHDKVSINIRNILHRLVNYYSPTTDSEWPNEVLEYIMEFSELITKLRKRHDPVVPTMAEGIKEYTAQRSTPVDSQTQILINSFLDRFYSTRIGMRILVSQHIALCDLGTGKFQGQQLKRLMDAGYVGIVCTRMNLKLMTHEAIELARQMCEDWYGLFDAPEVELICDPNLEIMYIPGHLNHMIFEVVKNSLRATVELHGSDFDGPKNYPKIRVIVTNGTEDITIKISDQGGGIPRSHVSKVWNYLFTTVKNTPILSPDFSQDMMGAPMAGFGYGLPVSRLYARYFGGDVQLISMEGYGTDVYLHLNKLTHFIEPLA